MGTEHFAIIETKHPPSGNWFFLSFWTLGKCYELSFAVHEIVPSKGTYSEWPHMLDRITRALSWERYCKTQLSREQLPAPTPEFGNEYAALFKAVHALENETRVLFCQDQ